MRKAPDRSFPDEAKEPVIHRVFQLVDRYPSRSEAARAWGMKVSTLQNYYKRKDINPTPRKAQLLKIAEQEGVTLDWLLTGDGKAPLKPEKKNEMNDSFRKTHSSTNMTKADEKILELLSFLSQDEKDKFLEVLVRKGIEVVLYLLDEDNIKLLKLDRVMKEKVLGLQPKTLEEAARLDEGARECGSDNLGETAPQSLASNHKQAG
ncbi:hypothetical protein BTJ39_20020 [Izhakiella australiensis]|uniref:Bacteriophage CI repressor N-terminal domain-containing protein n=1 Tax=Izhakiella australiensis TaxID=1926881 RepID=A0A1S8YFD3_9GAMM|nr:helix-turn-helix domain-containing protein [Izhakiella australiensis]OON37488.1 hypothetical protein BTJ39_20020 [Izhakiella australiensis]